MDDATRARAKLLAPEPPRICLVFVTCNRLDYTMRSLPRLLEDADEAFDLVVWDNGSTDGTQDFLRGVIDRRIQELVLRPTNEGQSTAANHAWSQTRAELIGKVDDDCLVTPGWTRRLAAALRDVPRLGGIGCWHFMPEDFDLARAAHKIHTFGEHRIVVHPHIGGTGFLATRADFQRFGPIQERYLQSEYWLRLASHGRVNGWYYPLILQEHMDDPRSPRCRLPERFADGEGSWVIRSRGMRTRAEFERWIREDARAILGAPSELSWGTRWRRRGREAFDRARCRLGGK